MAILYPIATSVAYRALQQKITVFYSIGTGLKELPKEECLKQRQKKIQLAEYYEVIEYGRVLLRPYLIQK